MMFALSAEVALERSAVFRSERLGPVALLPFETVWQQRGVVDVVGGAAFEALHQVSQSGGGREADDDVDVVGGAPGSEEDASDLARLVAENRRKRRVEPQWEERPAPTGGPDDMDEEEHRRASGHGGPSVAWPCRCARRVRKGARMETGDEARSYCRP